MVQGTGRQEPIGNGACGDGRICHASGVFERKCAEKTTVAAGHRRCDVVRDAMTTMLGLNERQRTLLAEKACDTANLAVGVLVFGQLLGDGVSAPLAAAGGLLGVIPVLVAVWLMRERRQ